VELFVGEKCSDKFGLESDFHVILGIFYIPQIYDMRQTALLPLPKEGVLRIFSPLKIRRLRPGLKFMTVWKNIVQPDRPQLIIWCMHLAWWIPKAKHIRIHWLCNTHCFTTATMVVQHMPQCYMCIASLVYCIKGKLACIIQFLEHNRMSSLKIPCIL
jgi:hypothetical protein